MRLIDADALLIFFLEMHQSGNTCEPEDVIKAITNAPTVQREGWVSVPEHATHEMCEAAHFGANCAEDAMRSSDRQFWEDAYRDMIQAAPTDKE